MYNIVLNNYETINNVKTPKHLAPTLKSNN